MKKYSLICLCCLVALLSATAIGYAKKGKGAKGAKAYYQNFYAQQQGFVPTYSTLYQFQNQQGFTTPAQQGAQESTTPAQQAQQQVSTIPAQQNQQGFVPVQYQQGFVGRYTGPSHIVTVAQAQSFMDKTPVILRGNIVQAFGGDRYIFRDSSGDMVIKIGNKVWQWLGYSVSESDHIEIGGDLKRDKRDWRIIHVNVKNLRKL